MLPVFNHVTQAPRDRPMNLEIPDLVRWWSVYGDEEDLAGTSQDKSNVSAAQGERPCAPLSASAPMWLASLRQS